MALRPGPIVDPGAVAGAKNVAGVFDFYVLSLSWSPQHCATRRSPRPDDPRIRVATQIPISSFPSGHLVTCVSLWGTFAAAGWISPWLVAVFAVLIALGRLGLGQHYPGDLLGGVVIGLVILAVVGWAWPHLRAVVLRGLDCGAFGPDDVLAVAPGATVEVLRNLKNRKLS